MRRQWYPIQYETESDDELGSKVKYSIVLQPEDYLTDSDDQDDIVLHQPVMVFFSLYTINNGCCRQ